MKFKDYMNMENYTWLSKPKQKFVEKMEKDGKFKVTVDKSKIIKIYKEHKGHGKILQGIQIYPDGNAVRMDTDLSVVSAMRSVKDWEKVMK
jgi:hypothetical protein